MLSALVTVLMTLATQAGITVIQWLQSPQGQSIIL